MLARILMFSMFCLSWSAAPARAEIVSTDQAAASQNRAANRVRVDALLAREDVRAALERQGVSPQQARERVKVLSDDEVATLVGKLDSLPAGGDGVVGALFAVFIILLVTDILGLTKVYPFTRSVR
jgi:hypothetical protein